MLLAPNGDDVPEPVRHGRGRDCEGESGGRIGPVGGVRQDHAGVFDGRVQHRSADDRGQRRAHAEWSPPGVSCLVIFFGFGRAGSIYPVFRTPTMFQ